MSHETSPDRSAVYDRQLLLFGAKREAVLELWEVQRYGADSYGDGEKVDPVSLAELEARCDWSALHLYALTKAGQNHGVLLGSRGWAPP